MDVNSAKNNARMRMRAESDVKRHIDEILASAARDIVESSRGIVLVSSRSLFRQILSSRTQNILEDAEANVNAYIKAYAKASITALGDKDTGATGRLLNSELFGETFTERNRLYMRRFFDDVVNVIVAGRTLKMKQNEIEVAVKSQFRDPYTNGIIDAANKRGAGIAIPAYGRGIYRSAYGNIIRNAQGTVSVAWAREEFNKARRDGAVGFIPHRGSDYPCGLCDGHAGILHRMEDLQGRPPYHARCCCYVEYVYNK